MQDQMGIQLSISASSAATESTRHRDLGRKLDDKMLVQKFFNVSAASTCGPVALKSDLALHLSLAPQPEGCRLNQKAGYTRKEQIFP